MHISNYKYSIVFHSRNNTIQVGKYHRLHQVVDKVKQLYSSDWIRQSKYIIVYTLGRQKKQLFTTLDYEIQLIRRQKDYLKQKGLFVLVHQEFLRSEEKTCKDKKYHSKTQKELLKAKRRLSSFEKWSEEAHKSSILKRNHHHV